MSNVKSSKKFQKRNNRRDNSRQEKRNSQEKTNEIFSNKNEIDLSKFKLKIAVIGVGGGGGNAVNAVIESAIKDVLTISYNTDAQVLKFSKAEIVTQIGPELTKGHGAGSNPETGKLAAIESEKIIREHLNGVHVAFVVAGMGGGTGTGAGPEIAKIALDMGILTIGLVTTPFEFEGEQRAITAKEGVSNFEKNTDVLIVISNQNLFKLAIEDTTFLNAFKLTDDVLCSSLRSFINTIKEPSRINLDIADFYTVMKGKKCRARMGCGISSGSNKGIEAAQEAMASPLLDLSGAMSKNIDAVIICIRCGKDTTLSEINKAVEYIKNSISKKANIMFGTTIDEKLEGQLEVAVFATLLNTKEDIEEDLETKSLGTHHNKTVTFEDLLDPMQGQDFIGNPISNAINEDPFDYCVDDEEDQGFFEKIISFFKGK